MSLHLTKLLNLLLPLCNLSISKPQNCRNMDSLWLQETLTEFDRKNKATRTLLDDDRIVTDNSDPESGLDEDSEVCPGFYTSITETDWEKNEEKMRFHVLRLIEENLLEQDRLVKRNDEKTTTIRKLCSEINRLQAEVKALQNCVTCRRSKLQRINGRFKISSLGRFIFHKVFGGKSS